MAEQAPRVDRVCPVCGKTYMIYLSQIRWTPGIGQYCSRPCRSAAARASRPAIPLRPTSVSCPQCGEVFAWRAGKTYCSRTCKTRAHSRTRRHVLRAGGGRVPIFTLREVAERDGWRCHLCGRAVVDRPWSGRPLDATLDHLVPVSDGGAHTMDNVALAHRRCNQRRGVTGPAQLRLIA